MPLYSPRELPLVELTESASLFTHSPQATQPRSQGFFLLVGGAPHEKRKALGTRLRLPKPSGRKNVLRKLLRIPYRRLKGGLFCVLTVFVCCWSSE